MDNYQQLNHYELSALRKLKAWQKEMLQSPGFFSRIGKNFQNRINRMIPEKVHNTITGIIKKMVETVLFTSELFKPECIQNKTLEWRENEVKKRNDYYRTTAAAEGGITGWTGFAGSLADFPALLAIKLKFLFDVASIYGYDTKQLSERIFLLHVFKLAFSSPQGQKETYHIIEQWAKNPETLPQDQSVIDWYQFQQEYRDYLDIAKLMQMIPVVGAAVGIVVNYKLMNKLSLTAIMCYRMRWLYAIDKHKESKNE
jgi:hypothetical protein